MKKIFKFWILALFAAAMVTSCNNESEEIKMDELSDYAKDYISMRLGGAASRNSLSSNLAPGNPVNDSFERLYSNFNGLSSGRIAGDSTGGSVDGSKGDTTFIDSPWVSCAVITTENNADGSITTTYDYGDGCTEGSDWYKTLMFGKFINTYRANQSWVGSRLLDSYYYKSTYDNYGGEYYYDSITSAWKMDGESTYSGSSEYDTATQKYKGGYEYEDETSYQWDTTEYQYKGSGKSYYDEKKTVVERNNYEYISGKDYYKTTVLRSLVSDNDCNPFLEDGLALRCYFMTYVSGRERIQYKQGEETGSFEIDYGNGECDRIITIIESGKQLEIDLGEDLITTY